MRTSKLFRALLLAAGFTLPYAAHARPFIDIDINVGTPPQAAHVPAPRPGYTQGTGHWAWNGSRYIWLEGGRAVTHPAYGTAYYDWSHGFSYLYDGIGDVPRRPLEELRRNHRDQRD